jgi:DNA-binding beta-propeller fold protein YncE
MCKANYKILIFFLLLLPSCVKDKPAVNNNVIPTDKHGVYIVCEGQFTVGNASLYLYKPLTDSVYGDIYQGVNKQPLGDVFQSMVRIGDNFFLAVNHSDKVVVLNASDLTLVSTITILSPRYILPVSNDKAYVSSLYSKKVYLINTSTFSVLGAIEMPDSNAEGMCGYLGSDAFITTWDTAGHNIYKVNTNGDYITQTIRIGGAAPHAVLQDKEQMLWVLAGNQPKGKPASLTRIDPSTGNILQTYHFPANADPIKPVFNNTKDTLYFIGADFGGGIGYNGIYRMGIYETSLPVTPFLPAHSNQYFWALGIDPITGYVYVGDPKGFTQKGTVYIYRSDATLVTSFTCGIGPGQFYFDQ